MNRAILVLVAGGLLGFVAGREAFSGSKPGPQSAAQRALDEPFVGVTADGIPVGGLFPIQASGVSTAPVRAAATAFLGSLTDAERGATLFPVTDTEWRDWNNVHRYARKGVSFKEMSDVQRDRAYGLLAASLSAKGLEKSRDIMRLNGYLAELVRNTEEYGEGLYHLTMMGEPSETMPWGWQLDGHHLVINYFVLRDQVVMTPTFMGSEPVSAPSGPYPRTSIFGAEEARGLALLASLGPAQRQKTVLRSTKTQNEAQAQAFRDNLVIGYAGIRATELDDRQRGLLVDLIGEYVGNMREGHSKIRMDEVRTHLSDTYFAWIGGSDPDSVFYYRVHSPVILIEFDHQTPVALDRARVPTRRHVHTVVRTPNGNDYAKDLLRQHHVAHLNDPLHGHVELLMPSPETTAARTVD
jgi:hypothetical protein